MRVGSPIRVVGSVSSRHLRPVAQTVEQLRRGNRDEEEAAENSAEEPLAGQTATRRIAVEGEERPDTGPEGNNANDVDGPDREGEAAI